MAGCSSSASRSSVTVATTAFGSSSLVSICARRLRRIVRRGRPVLRRAFFGSVAPTGAMSLLGFAFFVLAAVCVLLSAILLLRISYLRPESNSLRNVIYRKYLSGAHLLH